LKSIRDAEVELLEVWERHDEIKASEVSEELDMITKKVEARLGDINQTLKDVISDQQRMRSHDKASKCLQNLRLVNPLDDMSRIEYDKENLVDDVYKWILEDDEYRGFTNWSDPTFPKRRLLWIKGDAGTGKTMLMIGIIRELSNQIAVLSPNLSYFFCQSKGKTDPPLNSVTAALRSLTWMLHIQQPSLISHLEKDYNDNVEGLFTDMNAQQAMLRIFKKMLEDAEPMCFMVDALDECDEGLKAFIDLISTSLSLSTNVRWPVSSRRDVEILEKLKRFHQNNPTILATLTELDIQTIFESGEIHPAEAVQPQRLRTWRNILR
jgi:hypothetical protein